MLQAKTCKESSCSNIQSPLAATPTYFSKGNTCPCLLTVTVLTVTVLTVTILTVLTVTVLPRMPRDTCTSLPPPISPLCCHTIKLGLNRSLDPFCLRSFILVDLGLQIAIAS